MLPDRWQRQESNPPVTTEQGPSSFIEHLPKHRQSVLNVHTRPFHTAIAPRYTLLSLNCFFACQLFTLSLISIN